jgi:hypothetical protein
MEKKQITKHLNQAIEKQVPDVWNQIESKLQQRKDSPYEEIVMPPRSKKRNLSKGLSIVAAASLVIFTTLTFTPALAAIQEMYDKIFSSEHIDDPGLKAAISEGHGQVINQTYYDEKHDINVHFQNVLTDDKETKLLLTYHSDSTNLENYSLDNFEGATSIYLVDENGRKEDLKHVGWGSRYYDKKENKVVEAISFHSIKAYEDQIVHLEIENVSIYGEERDSKVDTVWPLVFTLEKSGLSERETIVLNKEFTFKNETYTIKHVEFSGLETRVVVTGTDTGPYVDENGEKFDVMSKLEAQLLNARKFKKNYGYFVDPSKPGVFLKSAGDKVEPIFSKNELPGPLGEYVMVFAPVKDPQDCILEIAEDIKINLAE